MNRAEINLSPTSKMKNNGRRMSEMLKTGIRNQKLRLFQPRIGGATGEKVFQFVHETAQKR